MKLEKEQLELKDGITKEWLITNGIGGYASSTVLGINTRKYHGLLVAPLTPPARRFVILSKIDESIEIEGKKDTLYSNICKNYISDGYKYIESFEKEYMPVFTYKVGNVKIYKIICMEYGKNTVCVLYKIKNEGPPAKFTVTPIVNFRDFHTMSTNHEFNIKQEIKNLKVKLTEEKPIEDYLLYTIKSGDSLWKIASMYDTTVDTLMSINNLKGTKLTINQQILVPKKKDIDIDINKNDKGIYYTVKSGDTLFMGNN